MDCGNDDDEGWGLAENDETPYEGTFLCKPLDVSSPPSPAKTILILAALTALWAEKLGRSSRPVTTALASRPALRRHTARPDKPSLTATQC
jgi:hypothetical protein